jgi:hypothetical protein
MPGMPRTSSKAQKIVDKIIGVPVSMRKHKKIRRSLKDERELDLDKRFGY